MGFAFVGALVLVVDAAEVGDDDRHGQGDDEDAAQRADAADDHAGDRLGHHVTVSVDKKRNNNNDDVNNKTKTK